MTKRNHMIEKILKDAVPNGHNLLPFTRGRWGFHTNCINCGAFVAITVSRSEQREGEKLTQPCINPRR